MFSGDNNMDIDEAKLHLAALESFTTGKITPILKEELKYYIQSRRLSEGKSELVVDFNEKSDNKIQTLRPDEIERQTRRRAQNRKASEKFRMKKKSEIAHLEKTYLELKARNEQLLDEVNNLTEERDILYKLLGLSVPKTEVN